MLYRGSEVFIYVQLSNSYVYVHMYVRTYVCVLCGYTGTVQRKYCSNLSNFCTETFKLAQFIKTLLVNFSELCNRFNLQFFVIIISVCVLHVCVCCVSVCGCCTYVGRYMVFDYRWCNICATFICTCSFR